MNSNWENAVITKRGVNTFVKPHKLIGFPSAYKERNVALMEENYPEWIECFCELYGYDYQKFHRVEHNGVFDAIFYVGKYTVGVSFEKLIAYFYAKERTEMAEGDADAFFHYIDVQTELWIKQHRKEFR